MPAYPGSALAALINSNTQKFLFNAETVAAGTASIAYQLERQKSASYPLGFAVEVSFGGAPGTFEVDVQGAETDKDANFVQLGTGLTLVNANNVARFDGNAFYPKFVRVLLKTLTNPVTVTAVLTR